MTAKLWLNGGKLVINGSGQAVLCETCPCPGGGTVVPDCCVGASLPATATLTYTIGALAPATMNLTKTGNSYNGEIICSVGDGHTEVRLQYSSNCFNPGAGWSIAFTLAVYVDAVLSNFVTWAPAAFSVGSTHTEFAVVCSPYHLHYTGTNTSGSDADGPTKTCGGVTYSFTSSAGVIPIVLDAVTP